MSRSIPVSNLPLFTTSYCGNITDLEEVYRIAMSEIEEIKGGKWDWKVLEPERKGPPGTSPEGRLGELPPLPGL